MLSQGREREYCWFWLRLSYACVCLRVAFPHHCTKFVWCVHGQNMVWYNKKWKRSRSAGFLSVGVKYRCNLWLHAALLNVEGIINWDKTLAWHCSMICCSGSWRGPEHGSERFEQKAERHPTQDISWSQRNQTERWARSQLCSVVVRILLSGSSVLGLWEEIHKWWEYSE